VHSAATSATASAIHRAALPGAPRTPGCLRSSPILLDRVVLRVAIVALALSPRVLVGGALAGAALLAAAGPASAASCCC